MHPLAAGSVAFISGRSDLLASLFAGPFMVFMRRFRGHIDKVEKTMGALLVVTGVLIITGQISTFAFWLLSVFPALGQIG